MSDEQWRINSSISDRLITRLVYARGPLSQLAHWVLSLFGTNAPTSIRIGKGLMLRHAASGVVIHPDTTIGDGVTIYQNVSIGRADIWRPAPTGFGGFRIEDHAIIGAGAAILGSGTEPLVLAEGSVVGANAVLTKSTGPWEVWAGNPARKVGERDRG